MRTGWVWMAGFCGIAALGAARAECPGAYYTPVTAQAASSREVDGTVMAGGRSPHAASFVAARRDTFPWAPGGAVLGALGRGAPADAHRVDLSWLPGGSPSGGAPREELLRTFAIPSGDGPPILALFTCGGPRLDIACRCHYLHHETFCAERILQPYAGAFRFLEVNVDDPANRELLERYGVAAEDAPVLLVVLPAGMVVDRLPFERIKSAGALASALAAAGREAERDERVLERRQHDLEACAVRAVDALGRRNLDAARGQIARMEEIAQGAGLVSWRDEARRWAAILGESRD